jgi:hypothetical protein
MDLRILLGLLQQRDLEPCRQIVVGFEVGQQVAYPGVRFNRSAIRRAVCGIALQGT